MADEVLTAGVPMAAVPTAVVLTAVVIPTSVVVGTLPMLAVDSTASAVLAAVVLTAVVIPTSVAVGTLPMLAVDSTLAAALKAVVADIPSAAILAVGCQPDPRRGAVARPDQLPLSIVRQFLLHQDLLEPMALPPAKANGTRLEAAEILLLRQREDHRVRGRVAQPEAGMAKPTKCRRITLDRPLSGGVRRPVGGHITG